MTWDEKGMSLAYCVAEWSKDPSTQVGAAIFDIDHNVRGVGYNGFPRGIADDERLNDRDQKYPRVVHAEANALLHSTGGHTLYCTLFPCSLCAGLIIQYGIKRIVTPNTSVSRWLESQEIARALFCERGIEVKECVSP